MHFMSRVFSNTTSLMTSVRMLYVGAMGASSYLSLYADKLLKGENQSTCSVLSDYYGHMISASQKPSWY